MGLCDNLLWFLLDLNRFYIFESLQFFLIVNSEKLKILFLLRFLFGSFDLIWFGDSFGLVW